MVRYVHATRGDSKEPVQSGSNVIYSETLVLDAVTGRRLLVVSGAAPEPANAFKEKSLQPYLLVPGYIEEGELRKHRLGDLGDIDATEVTPVQRGEEGRIEVLLNNQIVVKVSRPVLFWHEEPVGLGQ